MLILLIALPTVFATLIQFNNTNSAADGILIDGSSTGLFYTTRGTPSTALESKDDLIDLLMINEVKYLTIVDVNSTSYQVVITDLDIDKAPHDEDTPSRYDFTLTMRESLNTMTPTI